MHHSLHQLIKQTENHRNSVQIIPTSLLIGNYATSMTNVCIYRFTYKAVMQFRI